MSVHVIYYEKGAKMMRPVLTREEYLSIRNSETNRHADKKHMVQMNYSCLPVGTHAEDAKGASQRIISSNKLFAKENEGSKVGLLKGATQPSNSVGMDVDFCFDEGATEVDKAKKLQEIMDRILCQKQELGLLMLERSASKGFHIVFHRHPEMSQEQNLKWASDLLGVEYDRGAKDITRVFFTPADKLIYLDDEIFSLTPALSQGEGESPAQSNCNPTLPITGEVSRSDGEGLYEGIPYSAIIEALENQLGGVPAHGSRNQFIFSMACHLRYICNDDPKWIAEVLPTYGEVREKWFNTIKSACNRSQNKTMPKLLKTAIEQANMTTPLLLPRGGETDSYCCGMPGSVVPEEYGDSYGSSPRGGWEGVPPMPSKLPPLIKLLISKTPKIYQPAVAHAVFPALASHLWKTRFRYIDNVEHEATLMNVLMAGTGAGKNCIAEPIRHIMKDIVERDQINREKERTWKEEMQTKGSNKDKKKRPEGLIIQSVKPDMTNAAFVQRMKEAEEHFLYTQMNEIDQFDALKTSARSKSQFQIMCLAFDPQNSYGTERVGTASVSETVCVRFNWNASTTIQKGKAYFAGVLTDGPISRINFCTIPERPIGSDMPVYGTYDEKFQAELKPYIDRLNAARGLIECPKATALANRLMEENADFARLSQSRVYENLSFRGNVIAFLKAMVLYVAQGEKWDKTLEDFIRWSEQYDLWCKMKFFGEAIEDAETVTSGQHRPGPQNLLALLGDEFTTDELQYVRRRQGVDKTPVDQLLNVWKNRKYVKPVEGKENAWKKLFR